MANNGWYKLESNRPAQGRSTGNGGGAHGRNTASSPISQGERQGERRPQERMPSPAAGAAPAARGEPSRRQPSPAHTPAGGAVPRQQMRPSRRPDSAGQSTAVTGASQRTRHSQTVGEDGPVVLQDGILHETLETFVHSKILERAVHVKGFGAFGHFTTTNSMQEYTAAGLFQSPGQQAQVLTRFSLAVSTKGTPDTGRNVRGFSTKFYTSDGVFDLLCNHIPVFLVRDAMRFPASINAFLPDPKNNLADPERFWGFVAANPEAIHFVTWLYSDVGTVKSLRHIRGYGVNTYVWKNAAGVRRYVKYHWLPLAGEQSITREEAGRLAGENPDVAGQDLYDTIAKGTPVEYELRVQLMDPADADILPYDPLDCTKTWSEEQYPLRPVGRLTLNRNPDNYAEQIEKAAFSPMNLTAGVELSNDKMLQGRSTVYWDAQRRRLGPDFRKIAVNRQENWTPDAVADSGLGAYEAGDQMRAELPQPDDFAQAGERYRSLSPEQQAHLVDNMAVELPLVTPATRNTVIQYLTQACPELGQQVQLAANAYASE